MRKAMFLLGVLALALLLPGAQQHVSAVQQARPNIIFVFTDDQDPGSLRVMSNLKERLMEKGKTFPNATFAQPLCCPSRATMLRGQYPHNTGVLDNGGDDGGHETFKRLGRDQSTYATWLHTSGYKTGYFGKYMNGYDNEKYVPPGWDRWVAADHAPATMRISNNGKLLKLGDRYETFDLAMKNYSLRFLKNNIDKRGPLFMAVSFSAPHNEFGKPKYEKRYVGRFSKATWPRTPNFNEQDRSDKPEWVRRFPEITENEEKEIAVMYRARLRSLLTVDDTLRAYLRALSRAQELDNTYIFYFTDNGWHMGNHALRVDSPTARIGKPMGKNTPYTEDIEFPLIVRGPQVAPNTVDDRLVSTTDVAPTFADIANASPTSSVDGRSVLPLLHGQDVPWRDALLVEGKYNYPWPQQPPSYKEVRTGTYAYHYYPETGEEELYDLKSDPYQLQSRHADPAYAEVKATLRARLEALENCTGEACKAAEGG